MLWSKKKEYDPQRRVMVISKLRPSLSLTTPHPTWRASRKPTATPTHSCWTTSNNTTPDSKLRSLPKEMEKQIHIYCLNDDRGTCTFEQMYQEPPSKIVHRPAQPDDVSTGATFTITILKLESVEDHLCVRSDFAVAAIARAPIRAFLPSRSNRQHAGYPYTRGKQRTPH